jgi:hypothetical protein
MKPRRPSARRLLITGLLLAFLGFHPPAARADLDPDNPPPAATPKEIDEGKKAAEEFEKSKGTKLLDPKSSPQAKALLDKLNTLVAKLGAASKRPKINYTVKVVEDDDVNAFTLPDGHIYVYRGLLDFAASDDEIAAVLAHEIGHNVRMHALRGDVKAKKLSWASLLAVAMAIAGGRNGANVAQFTNLMLVGVLNGYTVGYEKEADHEAVGMLIKAGYNPSALVTFMQRLQLQEDRRPEVHLGIYQTHPPSVERAEAAMEDLRKAGVPFTPRAVTGAREVEVKEKDDRFQVQLNELTLVEIAKTTPDAKQRADAAAAQIQNLLRANLQMFEIHVTPDARLLGRDQLIATATPAEAKLTNVTPQAVAQAWSANFQRLFWRERLNGKM